MSNSFKSLCRGLALASWCLLVFSLLGLCLFGWALVYSRMPELWATEFLDRVEALRLVAWQRGGLWVLAVAAAAPLMMVFSDLGRLFSGFAKGDVFTVDAAARIRSVGLLLIITALLHVVLGAMRSVLVSALNLPGERMLSIAFGSEQVILLLLGGFVLVIGQAMAEATRLQDENRSFI